MDDSLIRIALIVLTLAAGLNLFLTLRLAAIVRPDLWAAPLTVPIGEPVPPFEGRRRSDGASLASAELAGPARRRLNPRRQAPFYLFLDEHLIVQASNLIGDEDWESFLAQMRETGAAGAAGAAATTP